MEKDYRDYGHDLDNTDTLLEGDWASPPRSTSPAASWRPGWSDRRRRRWQRCRSSCRCFPPTLLHHGEVVYRDDVPLGDVHAASYGTPSVAPSASR